MSLLTLIQTACSRIGLPLPASVVGNQDPQVVELLVHANKEAAELSQAVPWQELTKEQSFLTTAAAAQVGAIPSDFDRIRNDTIFNRTLRRRVYGPISPEQWQMRQAFPAALTVDYWYRLRGNDFLLTPTPPAGQTIAYEYISKNWCQSAGGTPQAVWVADTDTALISESLIALGVDWRFKKSQNLPWIEDYRAYESEIQKYATKQAGAPRLTIGSRTSQRFATNVPEGNWPSS